MARGTTTIWLSRPSRFAGLSPQAARAGLLLLAILIAASFLVFSAPTPPPAHGDPARRGEEQADVVLYETIVDSVRHGGAYYPVAAEALRAGNYPLRPFVTFRLPTLAMVQAALPARAVPILLYALVAVVAVAWYKRLYPAFTRGPPRIVAMALLAGGLMAFVQADLVYFHEIWAGLLIALSLAVYRPDHWGAAIALGLAAALIRETAALYLLLMVALAAAAGDRRETLAWTLALAVLAAAIAAHAHAVGLVVRPLDPVSPGWAGHLGFGLFVRTMAISTALAIAPLWLAAPLVALALFGWAAWRSELGLRVLVTLAAYAALLAVFGRVDTFYWGLLVAPVLLIGLAFVPDGVRDLIVAAHAVRRATVTRVVR